MLVLSRQTDQTIMIGDDVEITVVEVKGDKVRLGIRAPRDVQVHRKEIYRAIQTANSDAATPGGSVSGSGASPGTTGAGPQLADLPPVKPIAPRSASSPNRLRAQPIRQSA